MNRSNPYETAKLGYVMGCLAIGLPYVALKYDAIARNSIGGNAFEGVFAILFAAFTGSMSGSIVNMVIFPKTTIYMNRNRGFGPSQPGNAFICNAVVVAIGFAFGFFLIKPFWLVYYLLLMVLTLIGGTRCMLAKQKMTVEHPKDE